MHLVNLIQFLGRPNKVTVSILNCSFVWSWYYYIKTKELNTQFLYYTVSLYYFE